MSERKERYGYRQSPSLKAYFHDVEKEPLLKREEERALARRIRRGDKEALDRIVRANLRFVMTIARRYVNNGLPLEDLINDGNLGLIRAARRFDERRGVRFISYAVWWIRQAMLQSLAEHSSVVRFPINRFRAFHRIGKASRELDQELGRAPSAEEVADLLRISEREVRDSMYGNRNYVSLDEPLWNDSDEGAWIDNFIDENAQPPDVVALENVLSDDIKKILNGLSEREKLIFILYFGFNGQEPMTLDEIGEKLNVSGERVRQIKNRAITRMRRFRLAHWRG